MGNKSSYHDENVGFRVKELRKLSPAAKSGLVVTTDFVLSANGKALKGMEANEISAIITANVNREVHLKVFSEVTGKIRDVVLIPSRDWPGEGLLGVVLKLDSYNPEQSTGEDSLSLADVYTKENPIARRSTVRKPPGRQPAAAPANDQEYIHSPSQTVSGVNAYSPKGKRASTNGKKSAAPSEASL